MTCILTGNNFSPQKLTKLVGIEFEGTHERGDINTRNDKKWQHGGAGLNSLPGKENIDLDTLLTLLENHSEAMKECGVEDIDVTLNMAYRNQCNWYLTAEEIKRLAQLNLSLGLTSYEDDSLEDDSIWHEEKLNPNNP